MARNGSGTMAVLNSFSPNTPIESDEFNANFSDIASEITNSLPRDGQAAMTGQLKASSGTSALPGITFSADTDTGFYRSAANTIGVAGTLTSDGSTKYDNFPVGTAMLFAQTAAPTGWTKSTTHNDKALRVVSGTASSGGTTEFTSVFAARTLTRANLPNDTVNPTVSITDPGHIHTYGRVTARSVQSGAATGGDEATATTNTSSATTGITATSSFALNGGVTQTAIDFAVQYVDVIIATKD